jgi:hypothetical protein
MMMMLVSLLAYVMIERPAGLIDIRGGFRSHMRLRGFGNSERAPHQAGKNQQVKDATHAAPLDQSDWLPKSVHAIPADGEL